MQPIGGRLKTLRTQQGWTQGVMATKLGLSRQTINGVETGKIDPTYKHLVKIIQKTKIDPGWLIMGAGDE